MLSDFYNFKEVYEHDSNFEINLNIFNWSLRNVSMHVLSSSIDNAK